MAPGPLRLALPDQSIDRDFGKALFLSLKKALEQGMFGYDKAFAGKVCVEGH